MYIPLSPTNDALHSQACVHIYAFIYSISHISVQSYTMSFRSSSSVSSATGWLMRCGNSRPDSLSMTCSCSSLSNNNCTTAKTPSNWLVHHNFCCIKLSSVGGIFLGFPVLCFRTLSVHSLFNSII